MSKDKTPESRFVTDGLESIFLETGQKIEDVVDPSYYDFGPPPGMKTDDSIAVTKNDPASPQKKA